MVSSNEQGKKENRIFWYTTPSILAYKYRHVRKNCCLNFQAATRIQVLYLLNCEKSRQGAPPKYRLTTMLYSVTSQKTRIFVKYALRTSDLITESRLIKCTKFGVSTVAKMYFLCSLYLVMQADREIQAFREDRLP